MVDFAGSHVVVTGGTGALGRAVIGALRAARAVCHVPNLVAAEVDHFPYASDPGVHIARGVDLADEAAVRGFYQALPPLWASIHLAGGFAMAGVTEIGKSDLMQQLDMNFVTAFLCCRAAVASMRRAGNGGRIVNTAARPALEWRTGAGMTAYTASKAAVASFTVSLAEEVVKDGILVNAVAPSILDTPANRAAMPKADHASWPKVAEVAETILFLASPSNKVTRGAIVPVYGKM